MDVREVHLYSAKVGEAEVRNFFNLAVKSRFPFLGLVDFSDILSLDALGVILKRKQNTLRLFVKERSSLKNLSSLIFPFRLADPSRLDMSANVGMVPEKFYIINGAGHDILDFIMKEDIEEMTIGITKLMGMFIAIGSVTDSSGRRGPVFILEPHKLLRIDLEKNPSIYMELLEPLPKKMHMQSEFPIFEETGMSLGADNFDPLQHTLVVGASGAGKSKALYVMIKAVGLRFGDRARTVIIDPHGEFAKMFSDAEVIDFKGNYIEPLDVGGDKSPMLTQLVSQLIASSIGQENKYSERVLFYCVHLLSSLGKLELGNISALLTDPSVKAELVGISENAEVKRFFDEEYNDIYIHHFNDAILPILNFIGEYQLYLGKDKNRMDLLGCLKRNRITVISFDPHYFGRRMISFMAGAIINQMYIMAITGKLEDKPTILVVDEFPRVETRVTRDILSETRKFNLYSYLSCQYLGQLNKDILDSIVANVRNIVAFKLNRQDAGMLSSIMEIKVEEYFKKSRSLTELEESKKEMFVRLHQRECIVRLFDGARYLLPMKLKIADIRKWGYRDGINFGNSPPPQSPGPLPQTKAETPKIPNATAMPREGVRGKPPEPGTMGRKNEPDGPERIDAKEAEDGVEDEEVKPDFPDPMIDHGQLNGKNLSIPPALRTAPDPEAEAKDKDGMVPDDREDAGHGSKSEDDDDTDAGAGANPGDLPGDGHAERGRLNGRNERQGSITKARRNLKKREIRPKR